MRVVIIVGLLACTCMSVLAAESTRAPGPAQLTLPPNFTRPAEALPDEEPIPCDLRASPDYVAGIDVQGRDVVPADLSSGREAEIGTDVFVETRSRNPRLRETGVIVNLPGLGAPACVPLDEKLRK
jgi:hypothetical protein